MILGAKFWLCCLAVPRITSAHGPDLKPAWDPRSGIIEKESAVRFIVSSICLGYQGIQYRSPSYNHPFSVLRPRNLGCFRARRLLCSMFCPIGFEGRSISMSLLPPYPSPAP
ncbi:uncharacterized protein BO97DRAFT_243128 [Aspergillus homomorphus CBS 101889]|uniref:Secreted protein n=1 Tax=Aspergillus homomorphus (strain CBS 101889) TaxID=1450537 RepID=A0A395HJK0_ASPHC|nr:hypothetical protein BO97DRAFT_243128 [Aspergillus homomorphus CBS 101889]RAL07689.1 hypothetical protein BO97DRAFT_243128 [Aspergillus homomorphus CBS 101889]